jgi:DNA-binding SARP family transcriptional activator/TolB-like protein
MLRLHTLGQLAVVGPSNAPARGAAAQRKPLALLALLAIHGAQGITRDRLTALLWPEMDEERSRQALRQTLYALRRDLGAPDLFVEGHAVRLNQAVLGSDVADLADADRRGDWREVVDLRRGRLLEGYYLDDADEFERWCESERIRIEERYRVALKALAAEAESEGRFDVAADWWRRQVAADPLDGRAVTGLMHALEASGAPGPALECAREHEARLREELGAGGDPGVLRLTAEIRARMEAQPGATRVGPPRAPALPSAEAPDIPVVGEPTHPASLDRQPPRAGRSAALATGLAIVLGLAAAAIVGPRENGTTAASRTVAVMNLEETSTANEGSRIGVALSSELTRMLGQAGSLRVLGPDASRALRDSTNRLALLSRELRAGSIVEGTVERIGDQVQLTVRLHEVPSGRELWSFHHLGPAGELASVQAQIATQIASRLQGELTPSEGELLARRPTAIAEAYDHFLRASTLDQANRPENEAGIRILRQAIETDSGFALAHAALARRYVFNGWLVSPVYLDSGLTAARRAVELDPRLSLAHFAYADLLVLAGKPATARLSYLKAIELNPSEIGALADLSDADDLTGRLDESLYWGLRAVALAPTSASVHAHAAVPLCRMGADEAAARWLSRSERRWPSHGRIQHLIMRQELTGGLGAAALARARRQVARDPVDEESLVALAGVAFLVEAADAESLVTARYRASPDARPYGPVVESSRAQLALLRLRRGDSTAARSLADTALRKAEADFARGGEDPLPAVEAAALHALLGRPDSAMSWLRRAHEVGWKDYRYARLDPLLAPVGRRGDFRELLAKMEEETRVMRARAMTTNPEVFAAGALAQD